MAAATVVGDRQEYTFQAEIKQLLHLLSHSLYQSREIAVRELISNASDALDKMRYISLTDESQRDAGAAGDRHRRQAKADSQLVIRDTGIGMTHDELVANLGTIAHSGSAEFLKALSAELDVDKAGRLADRPVRRRVLLGVHDRRSRAGADAELHRGVGLGVGVGRDRHASRSRPPTARCRAAPR